VIKTGHIVSAVITANNGKDSALANKTKQAEPLGDSILCQRKIVCWA